jgi:hypothetical protein
MTNSADEAAARVSQLHQRLNGLWRDPTLVDQFMRDLRATAQCPEGRASLERVPNGTNELMLLRLCDLLPAAAKELIELGVDPHRSHYPDSAAATRAECLFAVCRASAREERRAQTPLVPLGLLRLLLDAGLPANSARPHGITPLHSAATESPSAAEMLLDAGADPFARSSSGETPYSAARLRLQSANASLRGPLLRLIERMRVIGRGRVPPKGGSVRTKGSALGPLRHRGAASFRKRIGWPEADNDFVVLCADVDAERLAASLASSSGALRIEADIASRRIAEPAESYPVVAMRNNAWSLALLHSGSPVRGTGQLESVIRSLTIALQTRVVEVWQDRVIVHSASGGSVEQTVLSVAEETLDAGPLDSRLADLGILVPAMGWSGDGLWFELTIEGLRKSDLLRVDLVVVRE